MAPQQSLDDDGAPRLPARFAIIRELGVGAMGEVFEVRDADSGATLALKLVRRDLDVDSVRRFKDEFRATVDVHHPNLVQVGELFEHDGTWGFTMELVEGVTWLEWVRRAPRQRPGSGDDDRTPVQWDPFEARFDPRYDGPRLWDALTQLAEALDALHASGACHRDVKPSNVLVTAAGRVVLLDFGLAAVFAHGTGDPAAGTVDYMAPEQAQGATAAPAVDLYAVGVMLYEALVGRPPFEGTVLEVLTKKLAGVIQPPHVFVPEVDPALDELCMALLARDPAARPTAGAVIQRVPGLPRRRGGVAPALRAANAIFVGREAELAQLRGLLAAPPAAPTVVSLVGGAGDGKSALVRRLLAEARRAGHTVCLGLCRDREHITLNGWDDLLDGLVRQLAGLPRAEQRALLPDGCAALARVFPAAGRLVDVLDAGAESAGVLEHDAAAALGELLARLGATRSVLVVLDDAHRATAESLAWLDLVLRTAALPAVVLLVHRPASPDSPFEAWLDRAESATPPPVRMFLGRLAEREAAELARHLGCDAASAPALARASGGNPLVLELLADGAGTVMAGPAEPPRLIGSALAELPPAARACLALAAVAARPLTLELIAAALEVPLDELGRLVTVALRRRLARMTGTRRTDLVELRHDLVRTTVLAGLSADELRDTHRRLARALAAASPPDRDEAAAHFLAARDGEAAAELALQLAGDARDGARLAAVARLCDRVLALELPVATRAALLRVAGEAWFDAGDASRAASAFVMALPHVDAATRATLKHRAAECFLRVGDLEQGMPHAAEVAAGVGIPLATPAGATIRRLLVERARLRLRGLTPRVGEVRPADLHRADACQSLAIGLSMVDYIRASLYQTVGLRHALDSGAPDRAIRGLALEAAFVAAGGHRNAPRAAAISARARALAGEHADAAQLGIIESAAAAATERVGDFATSVVHADRARVHHRARGGRQLWEERSGEIFALRSLAWLGRWGELEERRRRVEREAELAGDQLGRTFTALAPVTFGLLGDGDGDEVEARLRRARENATAGSFQSVHFYALYTEATLLLARGRGADAVALLASRWDAMVGSQILRIEMHRGMIWELRARAALRAGDLDEAARCARRADVAPWLAGPVALIHAAVALGRGRATEAARRFTIAAERADHHHLALYAAAARWRRDGDDGALAAVRALGIRQPAAVLALLAPVS